MDEEKRETLIAEFVHTLRGENSAVRLDYLVENTEASNRIEAKEVLRYMIRREYVKTTPGFRYKLSSRMKSVNLSSKEGNGST